MLQWLRQSVVVQCELSLLLAVAHASPTPPVTSPSSQRAAPAHAAVRAPAPAASRQQHRPALTSQYRAPAIRQQAYAPQPAHQSPNQQPYNKRPNQQPYNQHQNPASPPHAFVNPPRGENNLNQPRASFAPAVRLAPPGLSFPIAAALPPRPAGPSSAPLSPRIKSRLTGRNNAQAAVQNESSALLLVASSGDPLPYRQQALLQYGTTIQSLQETRAPLGTPPQPETDVPLAKSHLDAARLCSQLNQPDQANVHVHAADDLLHGLLAASLAKPLPRGWLWRINYLLGDVNLYQNNRLLALYFYQQADSLNPSFPPTMALVQFLGGTPITPPPPAGTLEAANTANTADQPIVLAQTQTSTQLPAQPPIQIAPAAPPPTSVTSAVAPAPRPQSPVPNIASSPPAPQAKPQDQAGELYITMKQLSASKMLPMAATAISLAAAVLGIAELAPVATAITLAGMIVDHAVSH